jgi:hypothetical protein
MKKKKKVSALDYKSTHGPGLVYRGETPPSPSLVSFVFLSHTGSTGDAHVIYPTSRMSFVSVVVYMSTPEKLRRESRQ